jgi:RNA polymerase-binding protein DksA
MRPVPIKARAAHVTQGTRTHGTQFACSRTACANGFPAPVRAAARHVQHRETMQPTNTVRAIRDRLHARRREVLLHYKRMLALAEEEQLPEPEIIDAANEQWDVRLLSRLSDGDARTLSQIVEALHRLQAGRYGVCTECDEPIEHARLHVRPEAARCFACARAAERPRLALA